MRPKNDLQEQISELKIKLASINERLSDPALGEDTVRLLLKTKNELIADLQKAEIDLDKIKNPIKPFERSLNESTEL